MNGDLFISAFDGQREDGASLVGQERRFLENEGSNESHF